MVTDTQPTSTFAFRTKAGNLAQLVDRLEHATVLPARTITVAAWEQRPDECLEQVRSLGASHVIVRSSAPGEDSLDSSHAGEYDSVPDVDVDDPDAVASAFAAVIASYRGPGVEAVDDHEVLVQPMVADVVMSGVVFTRDLERNAPYYVLNYDRTGRTDSVTAGLDVDTELLRVYRDTHQDRLADDIGQVIRMARELEEITGSDALDIEFATSSEGLPILLQVRPLAQTRLMSLTRLDRRVGREVERMASFVRHKIAPQPHVHGGTGILGEMPDWNPAEIIGSHPKPLASSLYRHLIMDRIWRESRELLGYQDPFPQRLLSMVGGRPYVDVRASFNSLLPDGISAELSDRLVDYYLQRLRDHPDLHDKVEFEIVVSCLAFDVAVHEEQLRNQGFSTDDVESLRRALHRLTERAVTDEAGVLDEMGQRVAELGPRRERILLGHRRVDDIPMVVQQLLQDGIRYGTLPFSVFARCAFIGTSLLRSMVKRGVLTEQESNDFLQGIATVAHEFVEDLESAQAGRLPRTEFLSAYGHLRPGTYDICTPAYAERPDLYLSLDGGDVRESGLAGGSGRDDADAAPAGLPSEARAAISDLIDEFGFGFDVEALASFISTSIQLRESVKFEFTKNLSAALELLVEFGRHHGLSREDMAFLHIDDLLHLAEDSHSEDHIVHLRSIVERHRNRSEVTAALSLPDLILSPGDVEVVAVQRRKPNFTSGKRIVAEACRLETDGPVDVASLQGKIVLIEKADPGYDWLFGKGIAGLVTMYGGAASHMAIRCAEFGLPAAIGCGEQIFNRLDAAKMILLDCAEQKVDAYGS